MDKIIICALSCFFVLSNNAFGQERVSDIVNLQKPTEFTNFIAKIDSIEYLIEESDEETKISKLTLENAELLFSIKERPKEQRILIPNLDCKCKRPLIYKEKYLIEIFPNLVTLIDITSGEITKKMDFQNEIFKISNVEGDLLGDTLLLYVENNGNKYALLAVDLETSKMDLIETSFHPNFNRINGMLYSFNGNKLLGFNLKNKTESLIFQASSELDYLQPYKSNGKTKIVFGTSLGKLYNIDENNKIKELPFLAPENRFYVFIRDSVAVVSKYDDDVTKLNTKFYNTYSGTILAQWPSYLLASDVDHLPKNLILLSDKSNLFCCYEKLIFEVNSNTVIPLSGIKNFNSFYTERAAVINKKLFFEAALSGEFYTTNYFLKVVDLEKFTLKNVKLDGKKFSNVLFRDFINDSLKVIATSFENDVTLWTVGESDTIANYKTALNKDRNIGIKNIISSLVHQNLLFFSTNQGIYYVKENKTVKVFDCINASKMVVFKNNLFMLVEVGENEVGYLKIKLNDFSISYKKLTGVKRVEFNNKVTQTAIINGSNLNVNDSFYLDLRSETYRGVILDGKHVQVKFNHVSGSNILIDIFINDLANRYIYNLETESLKSLANEYVGYAEVYPTIDGGFYLAFNKEKYRYLKKIKPNFEIDSLFEIYDSRPYYKNKEVGLDGEVSTFALPGKDETIFISEKNGDMLQTKLKNIGTFYFPGFYWKETGDVLVAEAKVDDENYKTFTWRYGEVPKDIELPFTDFLIYETHIHNNDLIILYYKYFEAKMKLVHYNISTHTIMDIKEIFKSQFFLDFADEKIIAISDTQFLINYNEGESGFEPWLYNIETHNFSLLNDIYPGQFSSNPRYFNLIGNYCYFVALDKDRSNQWFRVKSNKTNIIDVNTSKLKSNPNPATNTISLQIPGDQYQLIDILKIYDQTGKPLVLKQNISAQYIDVSSLKAGLYILTAQVGQNLTQYKIVKI